MDYSPISTRRRAILQGGRSQGGIRIAYIVTDDDRRFQSVARRLPDAVEPFGSMSRT